ncbi:MAG: J domain-containing protein [Rhodospirillaceae bacterium]|nr:J domain-containing protein [Rhodospirillaceae bacterium]
MSRVKAAAPLNRANPGACPCAWAGCAAEGVYRAPQDRTLTSYVKFCLEHVRQYNAKWDFHIHMSPQDIEAEIRRVTTWDRPTWPLGSNTATAKKARPWTRADIKDPLDLGSGTAFDTKQRKRAHAKSWAEDVGLKSEERKALKVFDLEGPLTLAELKNRYKALVKQHHPDKHGGAKDAEARMKTINSAYQVLSAALRRTSKA